MRNHRCSTSEGPFVFRRKPQDKKQKMGAVAVPTVLINCAAELNSVGIKYAMLYLESFHKDRNPRFLRPVCEPSAARSAKKVVALDSRADPTTGEGDIAPSGRIPASWLRPLGASDNDSQVPSVPEWNRRGPLSKREPRTCFSGHSLLFP